MTLIAFTCSEDQAWVMTDTLTYKTSVVTKIAHTTKIDALAHIDTVITSQGDGTFGLFAKMAITSIAQESDSLDEVLPQVTAHLVDLWHHQLDDGEADWRYDSTVFLVGYSPQAQGFRAYGFASEHGFETFEISGQWVMPMPWTGRPTALELGRLRREFGADKAAGEVLDEWATAPELVAAETVEEKVQLAYQVRRLRALTPFAKTLVGGSVLLTELQRGIVATYKMLDFDDDDPEEFARLVEGTLHPVSQLGPCPCGSGVRHLDCHLVQITDAPCPCGSITTFRECCMVHEGPLDGVATSSGSGRPGASSETVRAGR